MKDHTAEDLDCLAQSFACRIISESRDLSNLTTLSAEVHLKQQCHVWTVTAANAVTLQDLRSLCWAMVTWPKIALRLLKAATCGRAAPDIVGVELRRLALTSPCWRQLQSFWPNAFAGGIGQCGHHLEGVRTCWCCYACCSGSESQGKSKAFCTVQFWAPTPLESVWAVSLPLHWFLDLKCSTMWWPTHCTIWQKKSRLVTTNGLKDPYDLVSHSIVERM